MKLGIQALLLSLLLSCPSSRAENTNSESSAPKEVPFTSAQTFEQDVLLSSKPVLVDFCATWCAPCKAMAPSVRSIAAEYAGKIKVYRVDIDDDEDLADQYDVNAVPTFKVFVGGKPVKSSRGMVGRQRIAEDINEVMAKINLQTAAKSEPPPL
jgi:thioredoxin 1